MPNLGDDALAALASPTPPPICLAAAGPAQRNRRRRRTVDPRPRRLPRAQRRAIHESVAALVDHLPEQMRLVICTRADPPLPLPRWRARGRTDRGARRRSALHYAERRWPFLTSAWHSTCSSKMPQQLVERTEGWAVGLQLAGLSLQGRPDPHAAIRAFGGSRHYMLEYLLEEVLARQPAAIQHFLLHTSILSRMCGPLCDAVTGARTAVRPRCWTCSARTFLSCRLTKNASGSATTISLPTCCVLGCSQGDPDAAGPLHLRASQWYEQNGAAVEAVQHALAAQAWDRAAHLLEAHEHDWWTGSDLVNDEPAAPPARRGRRARPQLLGLQSVVSPDQRTAAKRLHAARYREGITCRSTGWRRAPGPAQLCGPAASLHRRAQRRAPGHSRSIPLPCPTFRKIAAACATAPR